MLDVMRRHAQSWAIKGIFIIIIIVFILFWAEPREKGTALQAVAMVNGSKITMSEYRRSYENLVALYRSIYREGFSDEMMKVMRLKEKALDNLIDNRLLLDEADRMGLIVSNSELIDSISKYPAFQKDNAFNKVQYMAVLKANRLTADEFEEGQVKNLRVGKIEDLIREGVKVGDEEIWDAYVKQNEKVTLDIIKIEPNSFAKDIKVSDDEAKEYFSKNKDILKIQQYEEAKDKVLTALTSKKAEDMALKKGEELLKGLRDGKLNISKLPYKLVETGSFVRGGFVPGVGVSEEMNKAAFLLTKEAPYPAKPFTLNGITYIVRFKEHVVADRELFIKEDASVREMLKQQKGEEALRNWLKITRTRAKIKKYEEFLQ